MFRVRNTYVILILLTIIAATTAMAATQNIPNVDNDDSALIQDAKTYASEMGVDLETALYRLKLQKAVGDLDAELSAKEVDTFAGLWIQHVPQFRVIVQFTQNGQETIRPYIENGVLEDIIDVRTANVSLSELEAAQATADRNIQNLKIPVESGINVFENRVELYVVERFRFDSALQESRTEFPEFVRVITVSELSVREMDIFAGLPLTTCTSGFSVMNSSGTKGIITAAHCSNSQSYNGTSLPFKASAYGGSYDVQWHTAPGFTVRNLAYDGSSNRYVYSTMHRNNQALNSWVCKHGKTTGYTCGFITNKNFRPGDPSSWSATFILVHRDGVDLSSTGDSGGPWFSGNIAYGVHTGGTGNDAYYMAVNYVDYLDLTVLPLKIYLPFILKDYNQSQSMSGSGILSPEVLLNNDEVSRESPYGSQSDPYP